MKWPAVGKASAKNIRNGHRPSSKVGGRNGQTKNEEGYYGIAIARVLLTTAQKKSPGFARPPLKDNDNKNWPTLPHYVYYYVCTLGFGLSGQWWPSGG